MPTHSLLSGPDDFFSLSLPFEKTLDELDNKDKKVPMMNQEDEFFSPLLGQPLLQELQRNKKGCGLVWVFNMSKEEEKMVLAMSIFNVPLKDIDVEVVG